MMQSSVPLRRSRESLLLVLALLAVDDLSVIAALLVEGANFCVVDRARDGDELVLRAALAKLLKFFKAAIDDMLVAGSGKGDAAAEPLLFLH